MLKEHLQLITLTKAHIALDYAAAMTPTATKCLQLKMDSSTRNRRLCCMQCYILLNVTYQHTQTALATIIKNIFLLTDALLPFWIEGRSSIGRAAINEMSRR
jgi:hypothetical protein